MESVSGINKVLLAIVIIGAINWGLVGFLNWNLVDAVLGGGARETTSNFSRIVYAIVGFAGLALLFALPRLRERRRGRGATTADRTEVHP